MRFDADRIGVAELVAAVDAAGYVARVERPPRPTTAAMPRRRRPRTERDAAAATPGRPPTPAHRRRLLTIPLLVRARADDGRALAARRSSSNPWFQLALATPVQFWAGRPFYVGALNALRHGTADMNTLIAVGTSAAYAYSVAAISFRASSSRRRPRRWTADRRRCTSTRRRRSSR